MNTDETRKDAHNLHDLEWYRSRLYAALGEIDRLEKIEVWGLRAVKWLNEKDNEIAKVEQRTKEACKAACEQKIEKVRGSPGLYLYEIEQAIDSVGGIE